MSKIKKLKELEKKLSQYYGEVKFEGSISLDMQDSGFKKKTFFRPMKYTGKIEMLGEGNRAYRAVSLDKNFFIILPLKDQLKVKRFRERFANGYALSSEVEYGTNMKVRARISIKDFL